MSWLSLSPPLWGLVFTLSAALCLWLLSLRLRDASIMEIFWGPGIAGVSDLVAWLGHAGGTRTIAVLFLVNVWAIRLAVHLWARHQGEDHRYAGMRLRFGPSWWWLSLVQVFLLQAVFIWFIPAPVVAALIYGQIAMGWLDYLGLGIAAIALLLEALADFQLAAFRLDADSAHKVMDRGLWGWSRHPNYFGEALMWWGYFAVGFSASHMWWLILSPLLVTVLLQFSGIALMEEAALQRRPGYEDYRRRVSGFVPLPPRSKDSPRKPKR